MLRQEGEMHSLSNTAVAGQRMQQERDASAREQSALRGYMALNGGDGCPSPASASTASTTKASGGPHRKYSLAGIMQTMATEAPTNATGTQAQFDRGTISQPPEIMNGFKRIDRCRMALDALDRCGWKRSYHQRKFHDAFIAACARIFFKLDPPGAFQRAYQSILEINGWNNLSQEILVSTPRREEKAHTIYCTNACQPWH